MNEVKLPFEYIPDPASGQPIALGFMYIGKTGLDPTVEANQITVSIRQDNGIPIPITQPISTSAGGVPTYQGSPVTLLIAETTYAIEVQNSALSTIYSQPNAEAPNFTSSLGAQGIRSFDTVALMLAATLADGDTVELNGYSALNDGGGKEGVVITGAAPDEYGSHTLGDGLAFIIKAEHHANFKQYGAGLGLGDDTARQQAALDAHKNLLYTDGTYPVLKADLEALPGFGLQPQDGTTLSWTRGATVQLEAGVDVRHVFVGDGPTDVTYFEPSIDGQNSAANGIGIANSGTSKASGVNVWGGNIRNFGHNFGLTGLGGGRAVTFQFGVDNCSLSGTHFNNCYTGFDIAGNSDTGGHGEKKTSHGITIADCSFEDCAFLGSFFNLEDTSVASFPDDLNELGVSISNLSFKNCGGSHNILNQTSWKRVNNAGNSLPWADVYKAATTFLGDWEPATYNAADAEWNPATPSYAINDVVKITNVGDQAALFHSIGGRGITIEGVQGFNEPTYNNSQPIGAIVRGVGGGAKISGLNVGVNTKSLVHYGSVPFAWPVHTRAFQRCENLIVEGVNNGSTLVVAQADMPINTNEHAVASKYMQMNCIVDATIRETGNSKILDDNLRDAANGHRNYIRAFNFEKGGFVDGNFDFVGQAATSIAAVNSGFSGGFKRILAMPLHVKVHQTGNQLRLERTGSSAGIADLAVNGTTLTLTTAIAMQIEATGGAYKLKNSIGTLYSLTVDTSGRLLINGSIVGAQS